nr:RNA-dependent RNA polymerase, eukaryotic-type [Tanacetum cinerariifolium]
MVAGKSADSLLTFEDQYIVLEKDDAEKHRLEEKMLKLTDLYYDALDAQENPGKRSRFPNVYCHKNIPIFWKRMLISPIILLLFSD